jgi:Fe-S cluster assembly iron-binding protein IscA
MSELIHFTPAAIEAIKQYRIHLNIDDTYALRVGIRQKNEANKRLLIGFDAKSSKDTETIISGIKVIYSPGEVFFFAGMTIDFADRDGRKGFTFIESNHISR